MTLRDFIPSAVRRGRGLALAFSGLVLASSAALPPPVYSVDDYAPPPDCLPERGIADSTFHNLFCDLERQDSTLVQYLAFVDPSRLAHLLLRTPSTRIEGGPFADGLTVILEREEGKPRKGRSRENLVLSREE